MHIGHLSPWPAHGKHHSRGERYRLAMVVAGPSIPLFSLPRLLIASSLITVFATVVVLGNFWASLTSFFNPQGL